MQRRKFLIGAASLAAGTAVALGTGATDVQVNDREVTVTVTNDGDAYLAIRKGSNPDAAGWVTEDGDGKVTIEFGNVANYGSGGHFGEGPGPDSYYNIPNVLTVTNTFNTDIEFFVRGPLSGPLADVSVPSGTFAPAGSIVGSDDRVTIPAGFTLPLSIAIDTDGYVAGDTATTDLTFRADFV